ncbi:MAG: hypothetical protein AMXMBFR59_22550 [Rhodanobacteraceae bacterium]
MFDDSNTRLQRLRLRAGHIDIGRLNLGGNQLKDEDALCGANGPVAQWRIRTFASDRSERRKHQQQDWSDKAQPVQRRAESLSRDRHVSDERNRSAIDPDTRDRTRAF